MKTDKKKLKRLSISFCKGWNWEDGNNIFDGIEYELFDKNLNSGTQFYEDEEYVFIFSFFFNLKKCRLNRYA